MCNTPSRRFAVLWAIALSLGGAPARAVAAQQPASELDRLARWLKSDDPVVRVSAVRDLGGLPNPAVVPLLLSALPDPSPLVRGQAAWVLGRYPDPRITPALQRLLADDNDRVRAAAVWSLCSVGGRAVVADVIRLARADPSNNVRFRAVWGFAKLREPSTLPVAIEALGDKSAAVRERGAVNAIGALADASVPRRLAAVANHPAPETRRLVMYLLARYPGDVAVPTLRAALQDPQPNVRGEAALALGRLHARAAAVQVEALLRDPDEHVRGSAAHAAGLIGDPRLAASLRPLLQDEAPFVQAIAAESLNRLGDHSVKPPAGFQADKLFTFPMFNPGLMDPTESLAPRAAADAIR